MTFIGIPIFYIIFYPFHLDTLKRYTQAYQRKNHQVMEKYWKVELLDMIPTWRAAKVAAQEMQKYSKSSYGDDFDEEW